MLRRIKDFEKYMLRAIDGNIGRAKEFLFDDSTWEVRYVVVDTGSWLSGRKVLISPNSLNAIRGNDHVILADLTRNQIEWSPRLESDEPVSHQFEREYNSYYSWPSFGGGIFSGRSTAYPAGARARHSLSQGQYVANFGSVGKTLHEEKLCDSHLLSTDDFKGAYIHALNGEIGHIEDLMLEEENWTIRYIQVENENWLPGRHVLISPQWIERLCWPEARIFVNLTTEAILGSPEYSSKIPNRDHETRLFEHYRSRGDWTSASTNDQNTTPRSATEKAAR
jgi:hypothetical protein